MKKLKNYRFVILYFLLLLISSIIVYTTADTGILNSLCLNLLPACFLGLVVEIDRIRQLHQQKQRILQTIKAMLNALLGNLPNSKMDRVIIADMAVDNLEYLYRIQAQLIETDSYDFEYCEKSKLRKLMSDVDSLISFSKRAQNANVQINSEMYDNYKNSISENLKYLK